MIMLGGFTVKYTFFLLQVRMTRIIVGVRRRSHVDPIFSELKSLKRNDIDIYLIDRLVYRIFNEHITLFQS